MGPGVLDSKAGDLFILPSSCEDVCLLELSFHSFIKGTLQESVNVTSET